MSTSSTKVQQVKNFFMHLVSKAQLSMQFHVNDFYQNVLNLNDKEQTQTNKIQHQLYEKRLLTKIDRQTFNDNNLPNKLSNNIQKIQQKSISLKTNNLQPQQSPKLSKTKFKINPRLNKLSKISKNLTKHTSPQQTQLSPKNNSQSKQKFTSQIKQITLKKLQLKNKLRKLNSELQKQKHSYFSFQSYNQEMTESHINPEEETLLAKLKNSSLISNKNPSPFNFSRLKSKSDAQFNLKRQSLKDKQAVYSPQKHEAAFKLIQKMHSQKLKKHEEIINDMKKKQQKQIETVKRLQIQRKKQKQQKIKRQKVLLTPNSTQSIKGYVSFSDRRKIPTKSHQNVLDTSSTMRQKQKQMYQNKLKQKIKKNITNQFIEQDSQQENRSIELTNHKKIKVQQKRQDLLAERQKSIKQMQNDFLL